MSSICVDIVSLPKVQSGFITSMCFDTPTENGKFSTSILIILNLILAYLRQTKSGQIIQEEYTPLSQGCFPQVELIAPANPP
jgi:hypothetical protein